MKAVSRINTIRFLGGRYRKATSIRPRKRRLDSLRNTGTPHVIPILPTSQAVVQVCQPELIYSSLIAFPSHRGGPQRGAISISSTGHIDSIHPSITLSEAKQISTKQNLPLLDLGNNVALSPGLIDVHCHISELGRDWEGYHTATRAAAAGGLTTLMAMPLNSIPATATVDALQQEIEAADKVELMADVGLWGGAVPHNTSDGSGLEQLRQLLDSGVFGLKAFLAPLPSDAGYETVTPEQLGRAARVCGDCNKPLLVHSELMSQEQQDNLTDQAYAGRDNGSYEAHIASRPAEWEQAAVDIVCSLADTCHMHVVHLSDAGCLDIIRRTKQRLQKEESGNLTIETCPHYLLFNAETLKDRDTRYKCFPPIRSKVNQNELWRRGLLGVDDGEPLIDMIASDHSPCTPDLRHIDTGNVRTAWGGLTGLQYQLYATSMAHDRYARKGGASNKEGDGIRNLLALLAEWWSNAPSHLVPGLSSLKGSIDLGQQADLCAWDPMHVGKPNEFCAEHHRWKGGGVYADMELKGRVVGTWLRGVQVYDGEKDMFVETNSVGGAGSLMLSCK